MEQHQTQVFLTFSFIRISISRNCRRKCDIKLSQKDLKLKILLDSPSLPLCM